VEGGKKKKNQKKARIAMDIHTHTNINRVNTPVRNRWRQTVLR
jgi:hypothetical protein